MQFFVLSYLIFLRKNDLDVAYVVGAIYLTSLPMPSGTATIPNPSKRKYSSMRLWLVKRRNYLHGENTALLKNYIISSYSSDEALNDEKSSLISLMKIIHIPT